MKSEKNMGRYEKRKNPNGTIRVLLILLVLSAALFGALLIHVVSAQRNFRKLSIQVREAATQTLPTSLTEIPAAETAAQTQSPTLPMEETLHATEETIPPTQPPMLPQYEELFQQNPELFGWLTIEGTTIDYPVMYTPEDPEKYLHADFHGNYSFPGTPFVDGNCSPDSDNMLIYGHNILNGSMFRSLLKYEQKNYWQAHPVITFNTLYEEREYEVLAAFYDRVYLTRENCFKFYQFIDAENEAAYNEAISQFREKSLYDTGVTASFGTQLITLVTCAYHTENGRFVVVARQKQ